MDPYFYLRILQNW